jgi:hypothetical protein
MRRTEETAKVRRKGKGPAKAGATAKAGAKAGAKAKPSVSGGKSRKMPKGGKVPVVLSGGNPRIAKADGDAPVQAYIAAMAGWKRDMGKRLDALIVRNVPNVRKAVKWNSPLYGIEGQGWFLGLHVFTRYIKVAFFRGTALRPRPGPVRVRTRGISISMKATRSTRRRWGIG